MSHNFQQFLVEIAAFFGFFQGIIWGLLSLIAIIWHLAANYDRRITYTESSYSSLLDTYFYYTFIKNNGPETTMNIQPDAFFGIMFVYLFISFAWMALSVYIYTGNKRKFPVNKMTTAMIFWACVATANLLIDLIFCSFLGADYKTAIDNYNKTKNITTKLAYMYSTLVYGIMMVLAARGFILWVINAILTGFVIRACCDLSKSPNHVKSNPFSSVPRSNVYISNLPEEARNFQIDETRRRTEPGLASIPSQSDLLSTSSSFAPVNKNMLANYDPQVEHRLQQYTVLMTSQLRKY